MGLAAVLTGVLGAVAALLGLRKWRESCWKICDSTGRLDGKTVVITGATSGLGMATAEFCTSRGANVVLACRDVRAAGELKVSLENFHPGSSLGVVELDLSSLESVRKCAAEILECYEKVDLLICNAGVSVPPSQGLKTRDGIEINFGVNHLGHFLLTNLLVDRMKQSAPARIIVVSSRLHEQGVADWDLTEGKKPQAAVRAVAVGPNSAYCSSKLANVLFAKHLAGRLEGSGVNVYAVCPGWNMTRLFRHSTVPWYSWIFILPVAYWFMKPVHIGIQTIAHCAVSEGVAEETGLFYRDCQVYESRAALDDETAQALWRTSCRMCGTDF